MPKLVLKISHEEGQRVCLSTPAGNVYIHNRFSEKKLAIEAPLEVGITREYLHADGVWRNQKDPNGH